ncbi:hypothetical protein PR048_025296, partial [Dryococelus australis]
MKNAHPGAPLGCELDILLGRVPRRFKLHHLRSRNSRKKCKRKNITEYSKTHENEEDAEYLYCGDLYSTSERGWVSCQSCLKWAHISCSGIGSDDDNEVLL